MCVLVLATLSGCLTPPAANSPLIVRKLQMVSAGYTGCVPGENDIFNISANLDGSGTWNATCKGKTYLCSGVSSSGGSESFSCALVAQ